ncbi:MAG TPA: prolipoprotein diacylglyceryl transferase [Planctomycetota bacterium]|nr:prolipoprotein diacylglyceryl transferase [Planctomycetota bacterium]
MLPELFRLPFIGLPIHSYGFMIMIGFLLAAYIAVRRGKKLGVDSDLLLDVGIIGLLAGMVGAKINHILQFWEEYAASHGTAGALELFNIGDGGLNWLGGIILGPIPFVFWYLRTKGREKMELWSWQNGVLLLLTLFFTLLGTRALYLYVHRQDYSWRFITGFQAGFVLYGGLIAGVAAAALYVKMRGERISRIADLSAPVMMIGIAFGRFGCFLNGCCYGHISEGFLGVRFPSGSNPYREQRNDGKIGPEATESAPVLPTQLFEMAAGLAFFFILSWYDRNKKKNEGETALLAGVLYPAWRFCIEFVRDDPRGDKILGITYSQLVSIIVFALCGAGFVLLRRRTPPLVGTPGDKAPPAQTVPS